MLIIKFHKSLITVPIQNYGFYNLAYKFIFQIIISTFLPIVFFLAIDYGSWDFAFFVFYLIVAVNLYHDSWETIYIMWTFFYSNRVCHKGFIGLRTNHTGPTMTLFKFLSGQDSNPCGGTSYGLLLLISSYLTYFKNNRVVISMLLGKIWFHFFK